MDGVERSMSNLFIYKRKIFRTYLCDIENSLNMRIPHRVPAKVLMFRAFYATLTEKLRNTAPDLVKSQLE
jgi:hypothetical protein